MAAIQEGAEEAVNGGCVLFDRLAGTHGSRRDCKSTPITRHGSRMFHQNVGQRRMFSDAGPEYYVIDLSKGNDATERKEALVSHDHGGSEA